MFQCMLASFARWATSLLFCDPLASVTRSLKEDARCQSLPSHQSHPHPQNSPEHPSQPVLSDFRQLVIDPFADALFVMCALVSTHLAGMRRLNSSTAAVWSAEPYDAFSYCL